MFSNLLSSYMSWISTDTNILIVLCGASSILLVIGLCLFVKDEYDLIKRKTIVPLLSFSKDKIEKDYNFLDFLTHNVEMLSVLFVLYCGLMFVTLVLLFVIIIVLGLLALFEDVIISLNWWLLLPVILLIVKRVLYKISLRYKE